jgi:hypothetical protein
MSKTSRLNKARQEKQAARDDKVDNDANKTGGQGPTQKNEGRRTPQSRHDRDSQLGSDNQSQARQNGGQ